MCPWQVMFHLLSSSITINFCYILNFTFILILPQMSPDGYFSGQEVGSGSQPAQMEKPPRPERIQAGKPPTKAQPGPKVPIVHNSSTR